MKKYGGIVIHENHDDDGILEIVEQGDVRSLHFGSSSRQSSILKSDPHFLQLSYVRAMTTGLIFNSTPQRILNIGLGGGSLVKFLLHNVPDCEIKAVEFRQSVAEIALSHFGLFGDPRLRIVIGDGGRYVLEAALSDAQSFDMIFVDAFDCDGMSIKVNMTDFYAACQQLLTPTGIMTMNLWGGNRARLAKASNLIDECFNQRAIYLPVKGRGNVIALAFAPDFPVQSMKQLHARAELLEAKFRVEFPKLLKDLKRNNRRAIEQFVTK